MIRVIFIYFIFLSTLLNAHTFYVSKNGSSIPPYSSWASAADSIYKAIEIAQDGDTIMIANGRYRENFEVENELCFLGMSRDSTIIDGKGLNSSTIIIREICTFANLRFIGKEILFGELNIILESTADSLTILNCRFDSSNAAIGTIGSIFCDNLIFTHCAVGVDLADLSMASRAVIKNSDFLISELGFGISLSHYGHLIVENCLMVPISFDGLSEGISAVFSMKSLLIKNNIINSAQNRAISTEEVQDFIIIENNTFCNQWADQLNSLAAIYTYKSNQPVITNNIFYNCHTGIFLQGTTIYPQNIDYNCFWDNDYNVIGGHSGENDIIEYPMFYKDPVQGYKDDFDVHLQKYSPLIDMGDSTLFDVDGSRSDIGAYGGAGGKSYIYQDLAPLPPQGFSISAPDSINGFLFNWDDNYEKDFMGYYLYRSFLWNFQPSPEYLLDTVYENSFVDTFVTPTLNYYYVLTAIDSAGNESGPTERLHGRIVSVEDEAELEPTYQLNQNYPNPFNPKTIIEYQLEKESRVFLEVLNVQGERVEVLANGIQSEGNHSVVFDGSNLASGVYIYRIQVHDEKGKIVYSHSNKMLLLK
ncbi:MAG: hypothetical protein SCALA702_05850 [Melioribacteraceae bacterium]|nr:MAG: hypothetical protein SCALA702_05850 [Melioribacteraceae bacterium]